MVSPSLFLVLLLLLLLSLLASVAAESTPSLFSPKGEDSTPYRPSVIVVVGIFAIMFTLTILLLVYAKLCHTHARQLFHPSLVSTPLPPRGASKTVIRTLPFFRFSALKGVREGLECSVCLVVFEDADLLRLLPKCKHAFHIGCVDRWLEDRASCPLCRCHVEAADGPTSSNDVTDQLELELFVERVPSRRWGGGSGGSSRVGSFRKVEENEGALLWTESGGELQHRFKHRIVVSEVVMKSRWSDVNSADLMSLNSEMLGMLSSKRFEPRRGLNEGVGRIKEETEKKRLLERQISRDHTVVSVPGSESNGGGLRSLMAVPGKRCMSEMANLPRFRVGRDSTGSDVGDERVRKVWLPIARRTVKWFAGRESRLQDRPSFLETRLTTTR